MIVVGVVFFFIFYFYEKAMMRYILMKRGIHQGSWVLYREKSNRGSLKRGKIKFLPIRKKKEEITIFLSGVV